MHNKKLDELVLQLENYIECWKKFNSYVNMARTKKFTQDDEDQFLEVKSLIAQELELIMASIESGGPGKDDIHSLIGSAPSIRYLSELNDGSLRGVENNWHKIYLSWQSILGQLKVQQKKLEGESRWSSLFGGSKKK
jgi:hypothetical protein